MLVVGVPWLGVNKRLGSWRLVVVVWRLAFGGWRLAGGVWRLALRC